jgi:hypothetical protein
MQLQYHPNPPHLADVEGTDVGPDVAPAEDVGPDVAPAEDVGPDVDPAEDVGDRESKLL